MKSEYKQDLCVHFLPRSLYKPIKTIIAFQIENSDKKKWKDRFAYIKYFAMPVLLDEV